MKKISVIAVLLSVFFGIDIYSGYSQVASVTQATQKVATKTCDVNKDGTPDVTYYSDGKHVARIEADTNYDGKPDVIVRNKDGKFESAEVDTNYDGKVEKKFTDAAEFNKWLNDNHSDFNDKLNRDDWRFDLLRF